MEAIVGVVVGVLVLVAFVGWCSMVVRAFKAGGFGWGLVMLAAPAVTTVTGMVFASGGFLLTGSLLPPILGWVHVARHEGDGKLPFALMIPGTIAVIAIVILSLAGLMPQEG